MYVVKSQSIYLCMFLLVFFVLSSPGIVNAEGQMDSIIPTFIQGEDLAGIHPISKVEITKGKKGQLNTAQEKLSTDLLQLIHPEFLPPAKTMEELKIEMQKPGQLITMEDAREKFDVEVADDLVYVYIYFKPDTDMKVADPYLYQITDADEANHFMAARVEVQNLKTLAALDEVRSIRTVMPAIINMGSKHSEGDDIHRAIQVREHYYADGSGIKIGIISDGVDNWEDACDSGDIPGDLHVLNNKFGGAEGTAMLEIVHDLAPGAELYFHDCGSNKIAFNQAIDELAGAGCNVICDDICWLTEPFFEDGIIASHVTEVLKNNNIVYVSSAGNAASKHYQGQFYDSGNDWHDFSSGDSQDTDLYLRISDDSSVIFILEWNDKFAASDNDYDLYLWDADTGEILARSDITQNGDDDPLEGFEYTNKTGSNINGVISINKYAGRAKELEIYIYRDNAGVKVSSTNLVVEDSSFGHPVVPDVIGVGSINANTPGEIAYYSSQGPVTITYPVVELRKKPDICGIDGVSVTGTGGFPSTFYGTSAAAPHVAALAALLWSEKQDMTAGEIRANLLANAVDLGESGYDYVFGNGRANVLNSFIDLYSETRVNSITIDKPVLLLNQGDTDYLTATIDPADALNPFVSWSSSDPSIVSVDANGKIEALSAGTAIITVSTEDGGCTDSCEVTVEEVVVDDLYTRWEPKEDVPLDYKCHVEFNLPMDTSTITEKNIYITDEDDEIAPMLYIVDVNDNTKLILSPVKDYEKGQTYTLWIEDIKSTAGEILKQWTKMDFTTRGIPSIIEK